MSTAPVVPLHSSTTVLPVVGSDLIVETVHGEFLDYAPFDHAASTAPLASVARAVHKATETYSSVHRGQGYASQVTSAYYEAAREEVARFVGAREGDHVIFTRNTTDSFTLLARALPRQTTVIVFASEHHATLLAWPERSTVRLPVPASVRDAEVLLGDALAAVTTRHTLVVLNGASNVTGEYWPVTELAALAHRCGARVAIDAAQLAPHAPLDLDALGADYLAFSGHKIYAPFGAGVLAGRGDWLDAAAPYLAGGGATAEVNPRGVRWQSGPARHEAGSPNVIGAVALAAACATLREHRGLVEARESELTRRLLTGLSDIDGVQTYSIFGEHHDRAPVVTFTIDGLASSLVAAALSAEYAIGVRDGKFCAHLLVDHLLEEGGVGFDVPSTAVRVSAGLATTDEHVSRLLAAVATLAGDGPQASYRQQPDQRWEVIDDPRDLSVALPW